jgi:hypothetical protein
MDFKLIRLSTATLLLVSSVFLTACSIDLMGVPPFNNLNFSDGYSHISAPDGRTWTVTFEYPLDSTFTGAVRHINHWYDASVPFMSHDILITTGDFASQKLVDVSVFDHKFFYHYKNQPPNGTINLLHVFPATMDVFEQLQQIKNWNNVSIRGREILKIDLYDADGKSLGFFTDMGCNTILVTSVIVNAEGTPIP